MKKHSISFFCPAYFDEENLPRLIPEVVKVLKHHAISYEIVIIHDGSPDNTGPVANALSKRYKHIRVVHHKRNRGYGTAIITGFRTAKKYDYVFYTDGDYQYKVSELSRLLKYIDKYDVVIGYRKKRALKISRLIQTLVFNNLVRLLFRLNVKDINCSMKVIKRSALKKIKLKSKGSFIEAELLLKLDKAGYPIKEVPVSHLPRKFGKASGGSPKVILQTVREMLYCITSLS